MLFATVRQRKIYVKAPQTVVKDGVNVDVLKLEMDDEWAEMTSIICVFSNGSVKKEVMHTFGQPITVPWECLESTGVLMLGITGYVGTQKVMTTMNADNGWEIVQNSETTGDEQFEATPTLTQQLLEAATSANNAAEAANTAKQDILNAVSNGEFDGAPGKDGADGVGIESVVQTTTSTEDGGTNVVTVTKTDGSSSTFTVKNGSKGSDGVPGTDGAPGVDGHTPVKGTDYFTDAEKQEIAEAAAEMVSIPTALPNPNALTFTGAVNGSYDGSEPVTVNVPSVTVDSSLTVEGQAAEAKAVGDAISRLSDDIAGVSSGGISATARNLLITILRNGVYSSDQSSNITDLENALGGSETVSYTITNNLTNVTNSNSAGSIQEKTAYIASLTAVDGYTLDSVTVTMGGLDVTADVYADGVINISSVTGDVEIVASAIAASTEPVLNTDGLVFDYDFRTARMESYNLSGWGNVYKTVDKTGTGLLFGTAESTGDGVGLADYNFLEHRLVSSETQKLTLGSSYTAQFLYRSQTLGGTRAQPDMLNWAYNTNFINKIYLKPKYLVDTTETTVTDTAEVSIDVADYAVITYVVDGTKLTVYYNNSIIYDLDGSNYDGFTKWVDYGVPDTIYNTGYAVSFVGYNRALSEVEIVDNIEYFKTLEVTA